MVRRHHGWRAPCYGLPVGCAGKPDRRPESVGAREARGISGRSRLTRGGGLARCCGVPGGFPGAAASPAAAANPTTAVSTAKVDPSLASAFEGKTVTLIVGANPGGGYDTWSRTVARFMGKHLPGNPQMIVQNMDGANHRVATNFIYQAKPDGLTFGMVDRYIPYFQLTVRGPRKASAMT